jgi:hypothetical protein
LLRVEHHLLPLINALLSFVVTNIKRTPHTISPKGAFSGGGSQWWVVLVGLQMKCLP